MIINVGYYQGGILGQLSNIGIFYALAWFTRIPFQRSGIQQVQALQEPIVGRVLARRRDRASAQSPSMKTPDSAAPSNASALS